MSSENWNLEKDLCRCCHSEGSFKNLAEPVQTTGLAEIYADMLNECFEIDMAPVPGLISAATYTICEVCVIRLRDASDFKKQVLSCEERFKDLYNRNGIKVAVFAPVIDVEIKQENLDSEPDDDFIEELAQDDNESLELQLSEEEEEKAPEVEVRKKRKNKTRKTGTCKTSKKKKQSSDKEENADEENDAEKKQGRVVAPKFFLREEDYKKVGDMYHCAKCDKTFNTWQSLRNHVKLTHYKILKHRCPLCNERFRNPAAVTVHKLKEHNVDDRVQCNLCNKIFNAKKQLSIHIKNFHMAGDIGERYKCEFCDYVAFKYGSMYKHMFKHKTVKDFHCKFCKKSFLRNSTLKLHERIHTGDRRKVCSVCGQAFVQKASLNYHMMKYHPGVSF